MSAGYLLHRVLLQFQEKIFHQDLSTVTMADGFLWLGCDETNSIERLSYLENWMYGDHQSFQLEHLLEQFSDEGGEVDIEGMDCAEQYLWLIGSHSTKRKKAKGSKADELKTVKFEPNRYLIARIPLVEGSLSKSYDTLKSAYLERNEDGNILISALKQDDCLAPFFAPEHAALPSKDNGFDIEGLAVKNHKLLIGLRGPVLRGISVLLEIEVEETEAGLLALKPMGKHDKLYKKHFLDLDGLGIRELCFDGEHLLIVAGPTMDLDGTIRVFRLKDPFDLSDNGFIQQDGDQLTALFDIPHGRGIDRAEGITMFSSLDQSRCLFVIYDSPDPNRIVAKSNVLADVFTLK